MPSTSISASDLEQLVGRRLEGDELRSAMFACKAEIEEREGDEIKLEIKDSNRIDLLSAEGIARTIKGFLGIETGLPRYKCSPSGITVRVDPSVSSVRPFVVAFVAEGVELTEELIASYMALQEKIHTSYGRGRRRMAIGFYDLDLIQPPISYTVTSPDENAFVPLGEVERMTPREILERHPKGREFAHLLEGFEKYPILKDASGNVLSMPPIINSDTLGHVTAETRNLFVEATGSEFDPLVLGINVLATALADRGGKLETVKIVYPDTVLNTPDFTPKKTFVDVDYVNKISGLNLNGKKICQLLERARYKTILKGKRIELLYPAYRQDIMHQRDVVEDVIISFGYNKIEPLMPKLPVIGSESELEIFSNKISEVLIGLGLQEIMSYTLTSKKNLFEKMNLKNKRIVEIENPVSMNRSVFRSWILPSLLEFLSKNKHVDYPQNIFEIGDAVNIDEKRETGTVNERKLAVVLTDNTIGYEEISSYLDALMKNLGIDYKLRATEHGSFIPGRVAKILINNNSIGIIGEINPLVLEKWNLEKPVAGFEMSVDTLKVYK